MTDKWAFEYKNNTLYYKGKVFTKFSSELVQDMTNSNYFFEDLKDTLYKVLIEDFEDKFNETMPSTHTIFLKHFIDCRFRNIEDFMVILWKNFWNDRDTRLQKTL